MAQVLVSFDSWKEGRVTSTRHEVQVAAPKPGPKLKAVSSRLKQQLMHPNKTSLLVGIRYSPDGKRIVAGDYPGGIVVVWDADTGEQLRVIEPGHGYRIPSDTFFLSPDGHSLFVPQTKEKSDYVEQDGKRMIRWEFEGGVRMWDLTSGQLTRTYRHTPPRCIVEMDLSPDGTRFLTHEEPPGVYERRPPRANSLWNVKTGEYVPFAEGLRTYRGQFSPDSRFLATTARNKEGYVTALKLFDVSTGAEKWSTPIPEPNSFAYVTAFSPDGRLLVTDHRAYDKTKEWKHPCWLKWWDAATGREIASFKGDEGDTFYNARFSPDGRTLAVVNARGDRLFLFQAADQKLLKTISTGAKKEGERPVTSEPVFSPDSRWIAILTQLVPEEAEGNLDVRDLPQARILLVDVGAAEIRETLIAPQGMPRSACFSPDGKTLATGGHGRVLLWDMTKPLGSATTDK